MDKNFLWEDEDNYIGQETFGGIKKPQGSGKGLTNTVDTFEQYFEKSTVQKIVTEPNHYTEQSKNSRVILSASGRG
jgi:hypothetical protein